MIPALGQVEVDFVERHGVLVFSDGYELGILFIFSVDIGVDAILLCKDLMLFDSLRVNFPLSDLNTCEHLTL